MDTATNSEVFDTARNCLSSKIATVQEITVFDSYSALIASFRSQSNKDAAFL